MATEVTCRCGQRFRAEAHLAGKQIACPACGQAISIPPLCPGPVASPSSPVVTCECGARFQARADLAGRQVSCPNCSRLLAIPTATPAVTAKGDSLWDDLPLPGSMPRPAATASGLPLPYLPSATAPPRPTRKRGFDYAPEEKNWELYYSLPLGVFIAIAGLIMLFASLRSMQSAFASSSWTSTTATILSAELIETRGRRGRVHCDAKVTYVYTVGGQSFSGTRISFSAYGASIAGEEVVAKYAPGTQHPCYYDPDRPAECVLEKGTFAFTYFFPILAVVVMVGGGLWAFQCGMSIWHRLS